MDASGWDARYAEKELVWSAGPNAFVEAEVADLPPGRALDLAGSEGRNAIWLAQKGFTVELVEFSRVALEKARQLAEHAGVERPLHGWWHGVWLPPVAYPAGWGRTPCPWPRSGQVRR